MRTKLTYPAATREARDADLLDQAADQDPQHGRRRRPYVRSKQRRVVREQVRDA